MSEANIIDLSHHRQTVDDQPAQDKPQNEFEELGHAIQNLIQRLRNGTPLKQTG